jgi:hypothetical protein
VDPGGCLAEDGHKRRIRQVRTGKLHVVRQQVGRRTVENRLARVCILALVPFEWKGVETNAHVERESNGQCQATPSDKTCVCPTSGAAGWLVRGGREHALAVSGTVSVSLRGNMC